MEDIYSAINPTKYLRTYGKVEKSDSKPVEKPEAAMPRMASSLTSAPKREPLTTRNAVKFLLEGNLKNKVCRYCLNVAPLLSELDQILQVADKGSLYKVSIKDMVASFHPFKVIKDPNLPDKICDKCVDRTISSYLFTQQCERAERALRNCFDDINEKFEKLDPIERPKSKRGRQKLNPNCNVLYAEHEKVIDYADPIIHIVNTAAEALTSQPDIKEFECLKCCEVLPSLMSLLNHTKIHPKSMWYNCRLCGKSFPKRHLLKKHLSYIHSPKSKKKTQEKDVTKYNCKRCNMVTENYYEYLQHIEKHKFKIVMEHLIDRNMDKLCTVCLNKESNMVSVDKMVCLHGGCPELTGDRPLYNVLASTLPEMNILDNYTGTKICDKCLSHAITSYVFVNQTYFVRNRLSTCVSVMLENLNKITDTNKNICIEIAQTAIMNVSEPFDEELVAMDVTDESNLQVEVLEDEFRLKFEDEIKTENNTADLIKEMDTFNNENKEKDKTCYLNGFKLAEIVFLKRRKKQKSIKPKFTCPICKKHFVSDYFLKRHILKHIPRNVECIVCKYQFKTKFDLYEHKKISHILNRSIFLTCKICGRCYTTKKKLKYHVKLHKNQFCQMCDKNFKSEKYFNAHLQRHMRKLSIVMNRYVQNCGFCEKDCPNDNDFALHVNKSHLQIKPYSCDMCERSFYTEYNLKCHQKVHSVFSRESCHFCDKIMNSREQLVIHIRKHIGDKPFYCQICHQSFYSQFNLIKHMKGSHGGRYCCKFCKTAFAIKKELKEHVNEVHNSLF